MVLSSYIIKLPYSLFWTLSHVFRKTPQVAAYCADVLDYVIMKPALDNLKDINITFIAKNSKVKKKLDKIGIHASRWPAFPDVVLMARHALHKFPDKRIVKVGFRHGAYHFKEFIKASYYNAFDIYYFTSKNELQQASTLGIRSGRAVGFPKLDPAFDGSITGNDHRELRKKLKLDENKVTVIFSATWDGSGMSALGHWAYRVSELASQYNILITLHHSVSEKYVNHLKSIENIHLIDDKNILPYLMISDMLVGDMSSIIAEFCALDKPIITFKTQTGRRANKEIFELIPKISFQIESFEQLPSAIENARSNPEMHKESRRLYNRVFFDELDGKAGFRAAEIIKKEVLSKMTI